MSIYPYCIYAYRYMCIFSKIIAHKFCIAYFLEMLYQILLLKELWKRKYMHNKALDAHYFASIFNNL